MPRLDRPDGASYANSIRVAPIIPEAWEHRHKRHRSSAIAALVAAALVAALAVVVWRGLGPTQRSANQPAHSALVAASTVLSKPPYLGVRCPIPNSVACDRVALAVWLRHPAMSVTATIAGEPLTLNDPRPVTGPAGLPRRVFDGNLQPAGIVSRLHVHPVSASSQKWLGADAPAPVVRLMIHYPGGRVVVTRLRVPLSAGYG
jgi:hypothetical protein